MSAVRDQDEWAHGFSAGCHGESGAGHTPLWRDGFSTARTYLAKKERERLEDWALIERNERTGAGGR